MFQTFYNINHSRLILTNKTLQENTQTKYNSKATQNTSKQYYPGSVAFYDTRPGNVVDLFYIHKSFIKMMTKRIKLTIRYTIESI